MRLIDADALIKNYLDHCRTEFEVINHCMSDENVVHIIQNAPTVEPPKQLVLRARDDEELDQLKRAWSKGEINFTPIVAWVERSPITDTRRYRAELDGTTGIFTIYRDDKKGKLTYEDVMRINIWRWGDED